MQRKDEEELKKLSELTGKISTDPTIKRYDLGDGLECVCKSRLSKDNISAMDCHIPAGGIFPAHNHDTTEWLIVYQGKIAVKTNGIQKICRRGDCIYFEPGKVHKVTALEETRLLGVTVPADPGYADGR